MIMGRLPFMSLFRQPISLLSCLRRGQRKRQYRQKFREFACSYTTTEQLEDRTLLAGASLVNIEPNIDIALTEGEIYNEAPQELTFKFTPGQQIDPASLGGIQIVGSGLDDDFGNGTVPVIPGYIGIGDNPNEVIVRFAESLPDDTYQITIFGTGATPLLNQNGEAFQDGVDQVINFELDLGAKVVSVVPQPVSGGGTGNLTQAKNQIDIYFNNDTLDQASAENPLFYQLIDTATNTIVNPAGVNYDPASNKVTLTFATDIADGAYHLRIGESVTPDFAAANVVAVTDDDNSSFETAFDLGTLNTQTIRIEEAITPQNVAQPQLPGGNDEPGHREITIEQHIGATGTTPSNPGAIPTITFSFPTTYGNGLFNEITENQKQRTREIYEIYSYLTGIEVQEVASGGTGIITGDIRAGDPNIPPLAAGGIAGGDAIMNGALDWGDSPYGGGWFTTAFHEIGHTLGLEHSYDLPSVMGSSGGDVGGTTAGEPIFPSNFDITHINRIHPALSNDIDLQKFELSTTGRFTAEITADRLPTKSFLDSVLTLYRETGAPGEEVREIIARNDDYFGEDAFLDLELEAGTYYLAVTSVGNTNFDPTVSDSGYGGRTDGGYTLDINFSPELNTVAFTTDNGFGTDEDTSVSANLLVDNGNGADSDPDSNDILYVSEVNGSAADVNTPITLASGALLTVNMDGTFDYDPSGAFNYLADSETATDSFTYTIDDGNGGTDTATATITINGLNDAPLALDDDFQLNQTPIFNGDVFADNGNGADSDPDSSDLFSVSEVNGNAASINVPVILASGATLTLNTNGTFTYDPTTSAAIQALTGNSTFTDSFTYQISDGIGETDTATVNLTISDNQLPIATIDTAATDEETIIIAIDVLANDTDPDGDDALLTVVAVDGVTVGTFTSNGAYIFNNGDGTIFYDPFNNLEYLSAGETTTDTFTYTLQDELGRQSIGTVVVTITGVNDPVFAVNDDILTDENTPINGDLFADNGYGIDSDLDTNDIHTVTQVNGFASIGGTPLVGNQITLSSGAFLTINGDGTFSYDPNGMFESLAVGETDTDTFTYTISDGNGSSSTATATIIINGVNNTPEVSAAVTVSATEDDGVINLDLLTDSSDPDTTDVLNIDNLQLVSGDDTGIAVVGNTLDIDTGAYSSLANGETETLVYNYDIIDGNGGIVTQTATIIINGVNDDPTAQDDNFYLRQLDTFDGDVFADNGNGADSDQDTSNTFTITEVDGVMASVGTPITLASGATLTLDADGTFSYDMTTSAAIQALTGSQTATDTFTYQISDIIGGTDTATVTIITSGNNPPTANDDPGATAFEGTDITVIDVLANDTDPDLDTLTISTFDSTSFSGATISLNPDNTINYDPTGLFNTLSAGETATDTFTYTMQDDFGAMDTATVTVTITGVNDDPTAQADSFTTDQDSSINGDLLVDNGGSGADSDPDSNDILYVSEVNGNAANISLGFFLDSGALLAVDPDGFFYYDPNGAFDYLADSESATDSFTYTIDDGNGGTSTATATITINGVNDDPLAQDDDFQLNQTPIFNGDVFADNGNGADSDPDSSDLFSVSEVNGSAASINVPVILASGATLTLNTNGTFTYDPTTSAAIQALTGNSTFTDSFTYQISDGIGETDTATVNLTISDNQLPIATIDTAATDEKTFISAIDVLANDTDPDGDDANLTVVAVDGSPALNFTSKGAIIYNNGDGTIFYDPDGPFEYLSAGETTTDTFTYTLQDELGRQSIGTVVVTITGVNDPVTAQDDVISTDENTSINGDLFADNGIWIDSDVDTNDILTVTQVNGFASIGGTPLVGNQIILSSGAFLTINGDGTFSYDPNGMFESLAVGETDTDTFTYTISDGNGSSSTATATIIIDGVNNAPEVSAAVTVSATEDDGVINLDLLTDSSDPDTTDVLNIDNLQLVSGDDTGIAVVGNTLDIDTGAYSSLANGETETLVYNYDIIDGNGGIVTQTATIIITGTNHDPVAEFDNIVTDANTPISGDLFADNGFGIDSDPDPLDTFTITEVDGVMASVGTPITLASGALLTVNADGTFDYDPNGMFESLAAGEFAVDEVDYTISDGNGGTDTTTISFYVDGVNNSPVANDDHLVSITNDPTTIDVLTDATGTPFDGDADGTPGGVFDFWFKSGDTFFVDKATQSAGSANGSLSNPYSNIDDALAAAAASSTTKIVRIVGNGGSDGQINTTDDNEAYLVGLTDSSLPLEDGATFDIPKDVTVMVDEGAIIKLQEANIEVGSNNILDDRSQGALQILGTPDNQVYLTAYGNDALGGDDDGLSDGANRGDWGGIVFRADSDLEESGIFLNSVNNANISYGGGSVYVNSLLQTFSPIHTESARPTIWQSTIHDNADSAISADPRSFEDSRFVNGSFIMDRHGLEIFDNQIFDNSINGLFVRINTPFGDEINKLDVPGIFNDDITHVITENLQIYGAPGGQLVDGNPSINGRLKINPGTVVKLSGARIEAERGSAQLIAEGTEENPIIFTSLSDDRYGAGTTFDTSNDGMTAFAPGNWGGIILNAASSASIDHALIANAGGLVPVKGEYANFNTIEVHQAELRISNSILENNASGQTGSSRNGRGNNDSATIFVRGAQPIIVDNIFQNNAGTVISIDANSLNYKLKSDYGRSTGFVDAYQQYPDNHGALVRLNRMENNGLNGMEVRPALLDTETIWDDTDIVHILRGEILVNQHHTFSGIRLQSNLNEGLVVKLDGPTAGFTADGVPLDIDDRIGGTVQIIGQPGFPVILTSLADDTVGASFTPAGFPHTDTNNDGENSTPSAGDWRSIRLDRYSNDRNIVVRFETEGNNTSGVDTNSTPGFAQNLGELAPDEISGDENRALGFEVHGNISADAPDDVDVYSFSANAGTQIWVDIDRTASALDSVVELVDLFGNVIASSLDSFNLATLGGIAEDLMQTPHLLGDFYSQNKGDAGFSVFLPDPTGTGAVGTYFIRVRSQPVAGNETDITAGQTSGQYQLQIRLRQVDEKPGSTVRYADIRYATNGVEVLGQPSHSPLLGESSEKTGTNETINNAQGLGNLLTSDRNTLAVSGTLSGDTDVDWYTFEMGYDLIQVIGGRSDGGKTFSTIFDIDYADGLTRGDTTLSVFDDQGRLILISRDSDIEDDQANNDTEDLSSGSFGTFDPYIGSVHLPSATPGSTFRYHVAISSNLRLPQALNATFNSNGLNEQIRLEPVSSVQRIVEDHIGFSGYTTGHQLTGVDQVDPVESSGIFDISSTTALTTNVTAFTLEDVNLYISQGSSNGSRLRIADAYDGRIIDSVDGLSGTALDFAGIPRTIDIGALSTASNDSTSDIAIRSDGRLYSYESLTGNRNGTAGRFRELNAGTAGTISSTNDGIPDIPLTGTVDPVDITTSSVGALAFQRTGVATYNLFYAVDDPSGFTTLYQANPTTGASGQDRVNSSGNDTGNVFTVLGDIQETVDPARDIGQVTGMSFRGINSSQSQSTLYAVTDAGLFLTISQSGATRRTVTNVAVTSDLSGSITGTFSGLTAAPQNLNNGAFQNLLFAITDEGNLYAIDPATGALQTQVNDPVLGTIDIFSGGGNSINVGATGITGLAFSPLDFNLWHPTFRQNNEAGHGINNTFDQTRTDAGGNGRDTFPNGLQHSEQQGGASFYFGFEEWLSNNSSTNDYIDYVGNAQYGVLSSAFQQDLSTNPSIGDNYNIAGGARGTLESTSFSLDGYSRTDLPTLYFNYFLETQNANSISGGMRDSARVFITNDDGATWTELATNNSTLAPPTDPGVGELSTYITTSAREDRTGNPNQHVQELFDNTGVWRQARVDLGSFLEIAAGTVAGTANLRLRFDFSTSGTISSDLSTSGGEMPGDIFGNILSNQQAQNNDFEGFYIDDIIIGFAERGEMVTGAQTDQTGFFNVPQNPTFGAPTQLLSGAYQLEIRRGTDYAAPANDQLPDLIISTQFDTNDRLIREDGQLGDRNLERQQGHISIESNSISNSSEYAINIDAGLRETVAAGPTSGGGVTARSQAGGVINGPELNNFFNGGLGFAPGVTVQNNVLTDFSNGLGGLRISGDENNSSSNNPAAVSYTKVVNNTLVGANVEVAQASAQIDVVFLIDVSTSMDTAIANVQNQILGFDAQMQAAGIDANYGFVIFPAQLGGFADTDPAQIQDIVDFATFTAPGSAFQNITTQGGTERGSEAILEALNLFDPTAGPTTFNYRPGSRIVPIVLTNEPDESSAQDAIDAQAALLASNALFYAIASPGFGNTDSTYGVFATSTGGEIFDINDFLFDPSTFFATLTADLLGQLTLGASGQGILVENFATTTILNNIFANTDIGIDLQSATGIPNTVGANLFKGNNNNGTVGTSAILLADDDPLFVNPDQGNFYLESDSLAIDSSLNSLADRPEFVDVKDPIGMPNSDIFAPNYDAFGQLRVDDPTQTPPPGLGSNIFKDRGAIERADFVGPTAVITLPADNDANGVDLNNNLTEVYVANPELFTTMIVELRDTGIGIDDILVNSLQFTLTAQSDSTFSTLIEGTDYSFSYNPNTNEAIFTSIVGVFNLDTLYTITVDNSDSTGVKDLAGNSLQHNQADLTTSFTIIATDGTNDPPVHNFAGVPIPDAPNLAVSTDSEVPIIFSSANGNALSVTDTDAFLGTGEVEVTLSTPVGTGTLTLGSTNNITMTAGTGLGNETTFTFTGLLADVNAALEGTTWTPDTGYFSSANLLNPATLTLETSDLANFDGSITGDGAGPQLDTDVIDITVNDPPTVEFSSATYSVSEDGTSLNVTLTRIATAATSTVQVTLADGTATAGTSPNFVDYDNTTFNVVFAANAATAVIQIPIIDDDLVEADETINLSITAVANALVGTQDTATVTIIDNDQAVLTIANVSDDEANGPFTFTITMSNAVDREVSVDYSTSDGTATVADNDYTPVNLGDESAIVFTVGGSLTQTFTIDVTDDSKVELDEIFNVIMGNLAIASANGHDVVLGPLGSNSEHATGTIVNDDQAILSISDEMELEGSGAITFTVSLSNEVAADVSVLASTGDNTPLEAIADDDYVSKSETLTFTAGTTELDFVVTINDDQTVELDERLSAILTSLNANGYDVILDTLGGDVGTGIIENDDQATFTISDVTLNEGNGPFIFLVSMSNAVDVDVTVDINTVDGSTVNGNALVSDNDYTPVFNGDQPLTFVSGGSQTQAFTVDITNDNIVERDEIFTTILANLQASGRNVIIAGAEGVGTILNDDQAILSIGNVFQFEDTDNGAGPGVFQFTVAMSNSVDVDIMVDVATQDGTATLADNDYTEINLGDKTLTFVSGDPLLQTFDVQVTVDNIVELDEVFETVLDNLINSGRDVVLGTNGTGVIRNDDTGFITIDNISKSEDGSDGPFTFTATLSNPVNTDISFEISTRDNTATAADGDFTPIVNQLIEFTAGGSQTQTFTVNVVDDNKVEQDELFDIVMGNLVNSGLSITLGAAAQGIIENDDSAELTVNNVSALESNGPFTFTVTLSNEVDTDVSIDILTQDGTAIATDGDYTALNSGDRVVTFVAGSQLTQTFTVDVNNDNLVEGDELFLTLLDASSLQDGGRGVTVGVGGGQATIRNDDTATLSITPVIDTESNSPFQFLVELSNPVDVPITVQASTIDGTASSINIPIDFQSINGQVLTFNPGITQLPVSVSVFDDGVTEGPETFEVILENLDPNGRAVFLTSIATRSSSVTTDAAVAVDVVGDFAYVADRDGGLQVLNVADPSNPFKVGSFDFNNQGITQGIDVVGNLAYLAVGEAGLQILNVSDPSNPTFVGSSATPARARGIQVIGNLAYVADDSGNGGGLQIIDISNPAAPTNLGSFGVVTPGGLAGGVVVIGNVAYVTDGNNGLQIVDVTDPTNPTRIHNVATPGGAAIGVDIVGNFAYVANREGGLQVIDISTPATASIVGSLNTPGVSTGVRVVGNFAYLADSAAGLQVIDISNPTNPTLANTFDTPGSARSLHVTGTLAFVADTFSGLQIMEFFPSTVATGTILDPGGAPLTGTASAKTTISTSLVSTPSSTDAHGQTNAVPESVQWIDEWDSFWVEVWGTTTDGSGISGGTFDLIYNTDFFTATTVEFGSAFGNSNTALIDDLNGVISGISGQNSHGTLGSTNQVLLGRVKFESLVDDGVSIDTTSGFLGPHNLGIQVVNAQLDISDFGGVTASIAQSPTTELWAVPFDLDDNGIINFRDLMTFASFYGTTVVNASSGVAWSLDFDKSGMINFKDLTYFAANYGLTKESGGQVIFPANFPKEWYGNSITTEGEDSFNELIDSAVDEWKTATGNEDLAVQVVVTDLGGQQLGEGQILELDENGIPVKGRIYIDDDAAGLGWYSSIEGLDFDSNGQAIAGSAADGHYDLYTVLLHEIGHVAGFNTGYSAYSDHVEINNSGQTQFVSWDFVAPLESDGQHLDHNFYPDDLLAHDLDPSTRKLISTLDVQIIQAAYANAVGAVFAPNGLPLTAASVTPISKTPSTTQTPKESFGSTTTVKNQQTAVPSVTQKPMKRTEQQTEWSSVPSLMFRNSFMSIDEPTDLDQLAGSLIDVTYETEHYFSDEFGHIKTEESSLGFDFAPDFELEEYSENEVIGEELDSLFSDWTGPLI